MAPPGEQDQDSGVELANWRQGDAILDSGLSFIHLADLSNPMTAESAEVARELQHSPGDAWAMVDSQVAGFLVLTQSCDLVRPSRSYVELAPLVEVSPDVHEAVRRLKRPGLAYVPALASRRLVADLDRTMTVEKAVLATLERTPGLESDEEACEFARALARKRARFAFPDTFNNVLSALQDRFQRRAGRNSEEGQHVDAVSEIRAAAEPHWNAEEVNFVLWLIKSHDPASPNWSKWLGEWEALIPNHDVFKLEGPFRIVRLEDMSAREYVSSQQLDLDQLSTVRTRGGDGEEG